MTGNIFGNYIRISSFGESHGPAIGVVIDGFPSGITFRPEWLTEALDRRRPGKHITSSPRNEKDKWEILSGVFDNQTLGTPISILVWNNDTRSSDYDHLKNIIRPGHADFTYLDKYGIRDYRGGGRQSARETVARVAAGAFARMILEPIGIYIQAFIKQIHSINIEKPYTEYDLSGIKNLDFPCPDTEKSMEMLQFIEKVKSEGDSVGGIIQCVCKGVPSGLGEPVFDKLHARLAYAMLGINACKGFEIGEGFQSAKLKGSENNDSFYVDENIVKTHTNHAGGVLGGISNGMDIYFNVAFKATSSIQKTQESIDLNHDAVELKINGRHDPCVVPRAVPIVEAMTALVIVDFILAQKSRSQIKSRP